MGAGRLISNCPGQRVSSPSSFDLPGPHFPACTWVRITGVDEISDFQTVLSEILKGKGVRMKKLPRSETQTPTNLFYVLPFSTRFCVFCCCCYLLNIYYVRVVWKKSSRKCFWFSYYVAGYVLGSPRVPSTSINSHSHNDSFIALLLQKRKLRHR